MYNMLTVTDNTVGLKLAKRVELKRLYIIHNIYNINVIYI